MCCGVAGRRLHPVSGTGRKNPDRLSLSGFFLAEREGFEPPEPLSSSVFKTGAIDHSATFPSAKV